MAIKVAKQRSQRSKGGKLKGRSGVGGAIGQSLKWLVLCLALGVSKKGCGIEEGHVGRQDGTKEGWGFEGGKGSRRIQSTEADVVEAGAIRAKVELRGVRVGEAENPGPHQEGGAPFRF